MILKFSLYGPEEEKRLDQFLTAIFPELGARASRSQIRKWIEEGRILVNGRAVKANSHLRNGDEISVTMEQGREVKPEARKLAICYEDSDILVLNKDPGLLVHPTSTHLSETLVNALLFYDPRIKNIGGDGKAGIVHRLDRDTSGLLLVAKTEQAFFNLGEAFRERKIKKTYLALIYGKMPELTGLITKAIHRHEKHRTIMATGGEGKLATTRWEVKKTFPGVSLLKVSPITGRTHQIRVHLSSEGHPIVADQPYGSNRALNNIQDPLLKKILLSMKRQALHAWRLSFAHPRTGKILSPEAPLPSDFANLLDALRKFSSKT